MPNPDMTTVLKTEKLCAWNLAGRVLRTCMSAEAVITHADDERRDADSSECGRSETLAQHRVAALARSARRNWQNALEQGIDTQWNSADVNGMLTQTTPQDA